MEAVAIAARRSLLDASNTVLLCADAAPGYALSLFTGVALGLWLLISLVGLRGMTTAG